VFNDADEAGQSATSAASAPTSPGDDRIVGSRSIWSTPTTNSRVMRLAERCARFDICQFAGFPGAQPAAIPFTSWFGTRTRLVGVVRTWREADSRSACPRGCRGAGVENALIVAHQEDLQ
jgi:hypothetical protein